MNKQLWTEAFLYASAAYALSMAFPDLANAAQNFNDLAGAATQTKEQVGTIPQVINSLALVIGIGLTLIGIIDLKKHADNPQNNPIKNGIGKLLAGGALVALPAGVTAVRDTVGLQPGTIEKDVGSMNFN